MNEIMYRVKFWTMVSPGVWEERCPDTLYKKDHAEEVIKTYRLNFKKPKDKKASLVKSQILTKL